jgi:hypothetical protein
MRDDMYAYVRTEIVPDFEVFGGGPSCVVDTGRPAGPVADGVAGGGCRGGAGHEQQQHCDRQPRTQGGSHCSSSSSVLIKCAYTMGTDAETRGNMAGPPVYITATRSWGFQRPCGNWERIYGAI